MNDKVREAARHFDVVGTFLDAAPSETGHIHDTYVARFETRRGIVRYVHQRINRAVFKDPDGLMQNIERVTRHARRVIEASGGNADRETLTLIPTTDGRSCWVSPEGDYWRTYVFIDGARTYDQIVDPRHVESASHAFGRFQQMLGTLEGGRLIETIPDFHNTPRRWAAFEAALVADSVNRARTAGPEIDFVVQSRSRLPVIVDMLARGSIPERVTHNDTKINNVMIDDATGAGICVIDLDTVMPGSALYDFGDMVRTAAATAPEDERDLSSVGFDLGAFELLVRGYLGATRDFLTQDEIDLLAVSAWLMTFEVGMRFLTDHLQGDTYFKVHRENHNLDRCRTQFKMAAEMDRRMSEMEAVVQRYR
jgi:hypothetical protein